MAHAPDPRITPVWLRPAAVAAIALLHAGIVWGAPWPSAPEPAVSAPLSVQVVPQGRMVEAISAPAPAQIAEVDAIEVQPSDAQPAEAREVEAVTPPARSAHVPEQINDAKDAGARVAMPVPAREQPPVAATLATPRVAERPIPSPRSKPKPKPKAKPKPREAKPLQETAAARARAQARAVAQQARAKTVAGAAASANYRSIVAAELNRRKFYPSSARAAGIHGVVVVSFTVGAAGRVTRHAIARSSGQSILDQAVHRIMAALSLPPPPGGIFRATVPIRFDFVN